MKRKLIVWLFCSFKIVMLVFSACNFNNNNLAERKNNQKKLLEIIYGAEPDLELEYFDDSIIKKAYIMRQDLVQGKVVTFYPNSNVNRITFKNKKGFKVGDETIFNDNGGIAEHLFWDELNNLLFYIKFKNNGKIDRVEGKPWFLFGPNEILLGDTLSYYIAVPIIPEFITRVDFGLIDDPSSFVNYINDLRQFDYKIIMNKTGAFKFRLKVSISDKENKIITCDSLFIPLNVLDSNSKFK